LGEKVAAKPTDEGSRRRQGIVVVSVFAPMGRRDPSSGPSGHLLPQEGEGFCHAGLY